MFCFAQPIIYNLKLICYCKDCNKSICKNCLIDNVHVTHFFLSFQSEQFKDFNKENQTKLKNNQLILQKFIKKYENIMKEANRLNQIANFF